MTASRVCEVVGEDVTLIPFEERFIDDDYLSLLNDADLTRYSEQRLCAHDRTTRFEYSVHSTTVQTTPGLCSRRSDNLLFGTMTANVDPHDGVGVADYRHSCSASLMREAQASGVPCGDWICVTCSMRRAYEGHRGHIRTELLHAALTRTKRSPSHGGSVRSRVVAEGRLLGRRKRSGPTPIPQWQHMLN